MPPDEEKPRLAEIHWEGDCREVLSAFPEDIRADFGFALFQLQAGKQPAMASRRMVSIGAGVFELKTGDQKTWYRVIYLSRIGDVIHVLHCFQKRGRKTDKRDLKIAAERLSRVRSRIQERRKHAKRGKK